MFRIALNLTSFILLISIGALCIALILITIVLLIPDILLDFNISINTEELNLPVVVLLIYLTVFATAIGMWKFYIVIQQFLMHKFFTEKVIKNLLFASYTSIFIWLLSLFHYVETLSNSSKITIGISSDSFGRTSIFVGLILFIFAKVFEKAKELSDENQLTI